MKDVKKLILPLGVALGAMLLASACDMLNGSMQASGVDTGRGAVIVAVEGLSFVNTLAGELAALSGTAPVEWEERDAYLTANLRPLLDAAYEIESFRWSGNASGDTGEILRDTGPSSLRSFLREKKAYAESRGKPLVVIGHSWGTVLTYLALSLEGAEDDPLEVDLYVTLSSPLGTDFAHSSSYPEELVITEYLEDWLDKLAFSRSLGPRAESFVNYWAWGDLISGPVAGFAPQETEVEDIRVDAGMFDTPRGSTTSTLLAYSNRNALDAAYWHKFTTTDAGVLGSDYKDYLSQSFIRDTDVARDRFVDNLLNRIRLVGGDADEHREVVRVEVTHITVVDEDEGDGFFNPADDQAEYFGYFSLSLNGDTYAVKRMRSENDYASLEEGEDYAVGWSVRVPAELGTDSIALVSELYEDELGDDSEFPGRSSVVVLPSTLSADDLPFTGSFDTTWNDSSGGRNQIRVHYRVGKD